MSKTEQQSAVLTVFSSAKLASNQRARLIDVAKTQLTTLVNHRAEAPFRAILTGLTLHRIKGDCAHGEWMPVYEQILKNVKFCTPKTAQTYCSQWMRAATEFLIAAKAATPETLALATSGQELSLETTDTKERAFVGKLEKFIDGRSLDELLTDLNLRNASKKKRKAADDGDADDAATAQAMSVQDRFNEIDQALLAVRQAASDKAIWMSFSKQQHIDLTAAADATAQHVSELFTKTHGRRAK